MVWLYFYSPYLFMIWGLINHLAMGIKMASEFSNTNFDATVFKFFANIINIFVTLFSALEDQIFTTILKMYILISSEVFKSSQLREVHFSNLRNISVFHNTKTFRFVSHSVVFKIIRSQLQQILCSFSVARSLKFDKFYKICTILGHFNLLPIAIRDQNGRWHSLCFIFRTCKNLMIFVICGLRIFKIEQYIVTAH
jgi:hypothetical protein